MRLHQIIGIILIAVVLTSCTAEVTPAPIENTLPVPGEGYPPPGETVAIPNNDLGYPAPPTEEDPSPKANFVVPTPASDTGVVTGKLIITYENNRPYIASGILLGKLIYPEEGDQSSPPLLSSDPNTDPKAVQNSETGEFFISDVPPGTYGLVLWSPSNTVIIENPEKPGEYIKVTVEANQLTELGIIPIP